MCLIYKINCKISGKSYCGQTTFTAEKRWQEHINDSSKSNGGRCSYLNRAIRHYL